MAASVSRTAGPPPGAAAPSEDGVQREILDELRAIRHALEDGATD